MGTLLKLNKISKEDDFYIESLITIWLESKTHNTQRVYKRSVNKWREFLSSHNCGISEAVALHLTAYVSLRQKEKGTKARYNNDTLTSSATIESEIGAIKSLYNMLVENEAVLKNPFADTNIKIKQRTKRVTEALSEADIKRLIEAPDARDKEGLRDRVILSLLFGAGLRRSELLNLTIGDVRRSTEGKYYLVLRQTKKGKEEKQAVADFAQEALRDYIMIRVNESAQNDDPLIVNYFVTGFIIGAMSDSTIYRVVKRYAKKIGCNNITPHSMRASVCTKLLNDGHLNYDIMDFSRHSSVSMLEKYYKRSKEVRDSVIFKLKFFYFLPIFSYL